MNIIMITEEDNTTVVTILNKDKIENSVYWSSDKGRNTAFDSNGNKICDFIIVNNHSIVMINKLAGIEVRKTNDPAFWWNVPLGAKALFVFSYDGSDYYRFV